jgi:methionyl aminopeptidase
VSLVELKTPREVEGMRQAGRIVARALDAVRQQAKPGVTPLELDEIARDVIGSARGEPLFLGYHPTWAPCPFPGVICVSVNANVVHGIPTGDPLQDGDLVSIDCGARLDGWCGDAAISFVVGTADPADTELITTTERALEAGIAAAVAGNRLGDISAAIASVARPAGYGLLANHGGHGIGRIMHEAPHVANEGAAGRGMPLVPGLVLALEPMLHAGGRDEYVTSADGWTLSTADGARAAHAEHTIAITNDGPWVLTAP